MPGLPLAHELGRLDALVLEVRRHADVGHDDLRLGSARRRRRARRSPRRRPTTSRSGCAASSARTPSRTSSESSARNTVIFGEPARPSGRCFDGRTRPCVCHRSIGTCSGAGPQGRTPPQSAGAGTPARRPSAPPGRSRAEVRRFACRTHLRHGRARQPCGSNTPSLTISWIPSEAVTGMNKPIFESGVAHYDDPPPDVIDDLDALRDDDRFRFANRLARVDRRRRRPRSSARATTTTAAGHGMPPRFASATKEAHVRRAVSSRNSRAIPKSNGRRRDSCRRSAAVPRCPRPAV